MNRQENKVSLEEAIVYAGFGKYNIFMLTTCCLLILSMCVDIFGFSVVLPVAACDMGLSTTQQGLLSAVPLIGVMLSSFWWGLLADTLGRRKTLLISMPVAVALTLVAGLAPNYTTLIVFKFLSAFFSSSTNAAAYVWCGESTPSRHRGKFMFLMAGTTMMGQLVIGIFAIPIFLLSFSIPIPWLSVEYRPWRLLMQVNSIPGIIGLIGVMFLHESPKFLLSKGQQELTLKALTSMYTINTGSKKPYNVQCVEFDESLVPPKSDDHFIRKLWNQTAPLFKRPLRTNSLKLYYLMLTAYMVSTGYTMWIPTMTNEYFDGSDRTGQTFCEVASTAATVNDTISGQDCDGVIKPYTLYAVMCYSAGCGMFNVLLSAVVGPLGKKKTTLLVYVIAIVAGVALLFVKIPILSIILFSVFLYIGLILGNVNTYLMELNPTNLRGMATCLSVVVARGSGFFSVQMIAMLLRDHCAPTITAYVALVISGLLVAFTLPPDSGKKKKITSDGRINMSANIGPND